MLPNFRISTPGATTADCHGVAASRRARGVGLDSFTSPIPCVTAPGYRLAGRDSSDSTLSWTNSATFRAQIADASVEVVLPVSWHSPRRARRRRVEGMVLGRSEAWAVEHFPVPIVVVPVFARLEAGNENDRSLERFGRVVQTLPADALGDKWFRAPDHDSLVRVRSVHPCVRAPRGRGSSRARRKRSTPSRAAVRRTRCGRGCRRSASRPSHLRPAIPLPALRVEFGFGCQSAGPGRTRRREPHQACRRSPLPGSSRPGGPRSPTRPGNPTRSSRRSRRPTRVRGGLPIVTRAWTGQIRLRQPRSASAGPPSATPSLSIRTA
jgi:hypothetical protein